MPGNKGMLYHKKDCNGCKALRGDTCLLKFKIYVAKTQYPGAPLIPEPYDPCPKPRTNAELREHLKAMADRLQNEST